MCVCVCVFGGVPKRRTRRSRIRIRIKSTATTTLRYCALLDCESFIHADHVDWLFVICVASTFPVNGIKNYLT